MIIALKTLYGIIFFIGWAIVGWIQNPKRQIKNKTANALKSLELNKPPLSRTD